MFPPLEPAMASIEPSEGEQCEGACIEMDMASFDALWRSEGGYMDRSPYQQVVVSVEVLPERQIVDAVTFRAAPWMKLKRDAPPSRRYLDLITSGARELDLPSRVALEAMSAVAPSKVLSGVAKAHGVVSVLCFRAGLKRLLVPLRVACYAVLYAGPSRPRRWASELATILLLSPTALIGTLIRTARRLAGLPAISFGPPPPKKASKDEDQQPGGSKETTAAAAT